MKKRFTIAIIYLNKAWALSLRKGSMLFIFSRLNLNSKVKFVFRTWAVSKRNKQNRAFNFSCMYNIEAHLSRRPPLPIVPNHAILYFAPMVRLWQHYIARSLELQKIENQVYNFRKSNVNYYIVIGTLPNNAFSIIKIFVCEPVTDLLDRMQNFTQIFFQTATIQNKCDRQKNVT